MNVESNCFSFALLHLVIGLKNLPHFINQSEHNQMWLARTLCSCSHDRAWCQLHVFVSCSDWFIGLSAFAVIGQSNYLGSGFTTLIENCSKMFLQWTCAKMWIVLQFIFDNAQDKKNNIMHFVYKEDQHWTPPGYFQSCTSLLILW